MSGENSTLVTSDLPGTHVAIDLVWDSSVADAPAAFKTSVEQGAQDLDNVLLNPITVDIDVGYGEINGTTLDPNISEGGPAAGPVISYSSLTADLSKQATSAANLTVLASITANAAALKSSSFYLSPAEEKAWGLVPAGATSIDGSVGFGTSFEGATLISAAEHEVAHAFGRVGFAGSPTSGSIDSLLDLLRYTSSDALTAPGPLQPAGTLDRTAAHPDYFSIDGGRTALQQFSTTSDIFDWSGKFGNDAFNAVDTEGSITPTDIVEMNAIGFKAAADPLVVASGNAVTYTSFGNAVTISPALFVTDAGALDDVGATISIASGLFSGDTLGFKNQNGIDGTYDNSDGVLTLSGSASVADYELALRSITYASTAADATGGGADRTRMIDWRVNDGSLSSSVETSTINVAPSDRWFGGAGTWNTAAKWSDGVPIASSAVVIGTTGSGSATLNETATISSLLITSGNTLADEAGAAVTLTISGAATVNPGGSLTLATAGDSLAIGGAFANGGAVAIGAGAELSSRGAISNSGGGMVTLQGGTLAGASDGNAGTTEGIGKIAAPLANSGLLQANGGTLDLTGALTDTATLTAAAGGVLDLGGTGNSIAGPVNGAGTLDFDHGGGTTLKAGTTLTIAAISLLDGAAVTLASNVSYGGGFTDTAGTVTTAVNLGGHTLSLGGTASLSASGTGAADVVGAGTLTNTGRLTLQTVTVKGGATIDNAGTVTETGQVTLGIANSPAALVNAAGHLYGIDGNFGVATASTSGSTISNAGTWDKTAGTGASTIAPDFVNSGSVVILAGTMGFIGGLTNNGTLVADGGTLFVDSSLAGTGQMRLESHGVANFATAVPTTQTVDFLDATGTIGLPDPVAFDALINGT